MKPLIMGLRSRFRFSVNYISLILFNSSVPLRILFVWSCYYFYCRFVFLRVNPRRVNHLFCRDGIINLSSLPEDLGQTGLDLVNQYLDKLLINDGTGSVILPRVDHPLLANFIHHCLRFWQQDIEAVFNSYFACHWISVYRTFPSTISDAATSFAWHYDEDPPALKKIFIYLNDTSRSTGAFRYFNKCLSRKLFGKGFISNTSARRIKAQELIQETLLQEARWVEGAKGHAFMFDNNIIHRGTFPETGYRTVISIEVMPSDQPVSFRNVNQSLRLPIIADYPALPWENPYISRGIA
jgi:hypothetical protein